MFQFDLKISKVISFYLNSVAGPQAGGHSPISIFSQESGAVSDLFCAFDWSSAAARLSTNTFFSFFLQEIQEDQDLVFVCPPDAGKYFRVSFNTVWYCRVLLLFSFYTSTDSGIKRYDCAFVTVSLLWEYDAAPPGTK